MAAGRLYVAEGLVRVGALAIGWNNDECFRVFISRDDYNLGQSRYYINDETIGGMRMFTDRLFKALRQRRSREDTAVEVESVVFYFTADNPTAPGPQVHVLVPSSDFRKGPPYILDAIIPGMFFRGRALFSGLLTFSDSDDQNDGNNNRTRTLGRMRLPDDQNDGNNNRTRTPGRMRLPDDQNDGNNSRSQTPGRMRLPDDQNDGNNNRSQTPGRMRLPDDQNDGNNNRTRTPGRMRLPAETRQTDMGQNRTTQQRRQTPPPARRSPGNTRG